MQSLLESEVRMVSFGNHINLLGFNAGSTCLYVWLGFSAAEEAYSSALGGRDQAGRRQIIEQCVEESSNMRLRNDHFELQ